jgi:hypothetical protein
MPGGVPSGDAREPYRGPAGVTSRPVVQLGPVRGVVCGLDYDAIRAGCATSSSDGVGRLSKAMEFSAR